MLITTVAAALFGGLCSVVQSSPVARDDDDARPISWQDPSGDYLCWAVQGALTAGSTIGIANCGDSQAPSFIYNEGSTSIQVSGTNLCVEFGPGLGRNGTPLRVQTCRRNGAPGQRLTVTEDNHIALHNGPGQCADVRDAEGPLQSWRCGSDNSNQIFNFGGPPVPPAPSSRFLRPSNRPESCVQAGDSVPFFPGNIKFVIYDSNCAPSPRNQWYIDVGSVSLRDEADNVYSLGTVPPPFDAVVTAVLRTNPTGQNITVEAGTGSHAGLSRVTIQDGSGLLCLSWGSDGEEERGSVPITCSWQPCRESDEYLYFTVDPPL